MCQQAYATRTLVQLSIFIPFSNLRKAQRTPFESNRAVQLLHPELRRPNPTNTNEPQLSTKPNKKAHSISVYSLKMLIGFH